MPITKEEAREILEKSPFFPLLFPNPWEKKELVEEVVFLSQSNEEETKEWINKKINF